jgi:hypothetical protein
MIKVYSSKAYMPSGPYLFYLLQDKKLNMFSICNKKYSFLLNLNGAKIERTSTRLIKTILSGLLV